MNFRIYILSTATFLSCAIAFASTEGDEALKSLSSVVKSNSTQPQKTNQSSTTTKSFKSSQSTQNKTISQMISENLTPVQAGASK